MATGYFLQDNPNPHAAQFGWHRSRVSGVIGVHTAENNTCFNGPDNGDLSVGEFVTGRRDFGSYHSAADVDSWRRWVHPSYAAWADTTNNAHAMSVSATVRANDWLQLAEDRRRAVVINLATAAADLALVAVRDGLLDAAPPARRISAADAKSGRVPGFYGHGETNPGTRYDPGKDFDWDLFLAAYAQGVGAGGIVPVGTINARPLLIPDTDEFGPGIPDLFADE